MICDYVVTIWLGGRTRPTRDRRMQLEVAEKVSVHRGADAQNAKAIRVINGKRPRSELTKLRNDTRPVVVVASLCSMDHRLMPGDIIIRELYDVGHGPITGREN